ncbi:hypothetical protein EOD39_5797 [Acipenser ruthenus]|uniref:Uncharacterized protein n=1 Tax=Acipenser ruthenus TaxID=7906 RepID=A0A444UCS6_ACIRT|nr:hypothetical protein EOD39_5797 [Acipenser ruthenus]
MSRHTCAEEDCSHCKQKRRGGEDWEWHQPVRDGWDLQRAVHYHHGSATSVVLAESAPVTILGRDHPAVSSYKRTVVAVEQSSCQGWRPTASYRT